METLSIGTINLGLAFSIFLGMGLVLVTDPRVMDKYINPGRKKRRRLMRPRPYGNPDRYYRDEE